MKKILLGIIYFLAVIFSAPAQTLYTTTPSGGFSGEGSIDKYVTTTNTLTTVHSFSAVNFGAWQPRGDLVQASDGKIYGMAERGGRYGAGAIYSFDDATSTYTRLKDFDISGGAFPIGSLTQDRNGKLYGMTYGGGANDLGVIFSFDISSSVYTKLKDFNGMDGERPFYNLMQAGDGKFYGMTVEGGANDFGVIFSFDPYTSIYTKLIDFDGINGARPSGNLIEVGGMLYGLTNSGGINNHGLIFSFNPSTTNLTVLKELDNGTGLVSGSLAQGIDGKLYATALLDAVNNVHVIFSFDLSNSTYTKLEEVNATLRTLMQASDGRLYGIAGDGKRDFAKIFSLDPLTSVYTELKDFYAAASTTFIELRECTNKKTYYRDEDGDGYGNSCISIKACTKPAGYVINKTDCDDHNSAVHAPVIYYRDFDGDGYGDPSVPMSFCKSVPPPGYVTNANDCNDHKTVTNPANERVLMCHNGISECVYAREIPKKLCQGWALGLCPAVCNNRVSKSVPDIIENIELYSDQQTIPQQYKLSNYPNPFVRNSTIKYELPFDSKVSIKVYDVLGRTIATLVDENKKAGTYTIEFNGIKSGGGSLYYRIIAISKDQQFDQTNKMIQIR